MTEVWRDELAQGKRNANAESMLHSSGVARNIKFNRYCFTSIPYSSPTWLSLFIAVPAVQTECCYRTARVVDSSWNVMAHGDAREEKWRGNWRMEWVASTLHTTSEHDVSSITTADAHTSAASIRLNWRPRRFKWTRPFRRKTKSAITFQLVSTTILKTLVQKLRCCFVDSVECCEYYVLRWQRYVTAGVKTEA